MPREDEPLRLTEDEETGDRFIVYGGKDGFRLDIRYATDNNFLGTPFYTSARAFMQRQN